MSSYLIMRIADFYYNIRVVVMNFRLPLKFKDHCRTEIRDAHPPSPPSSPFSFTCHLHFGGKKETVIIRKFRGSLMTDVQTDDKQQKEILWEKKQRKDLKGFRNVNQTEFFSGVFFI